jgi:hypothetical protein
MSARVVTAKPTLEQLAKYIAGSPTICVRLGWRHAASDGLSIRATLMCGHTITVALPEQVDPNSGEVIPFLERAARPCACPVHDPLEGLRAARAASQVPPPLTDVLIAAVWAAAYVRHGSSTGDAVAGANAEVARLRAWSGE